MGGSSADAKESMKMMDDADKQQKEGEDAIAKAKDLREKDAPDKFKDVLVQEGTGDKYAFKADGPCYKSKTIGTFCETTDGKDYGCKPVDGKNKCVAEKAEKDEDK